MPIVSIELIERHIAGSPLLRKVYELLENDVEVQELLRMSNVMTVTRLKYNDHGVVHSRIVSGAALEIFDILVGKGITPSCIRDKISSSLEDAKVIVLMAAYLHDIGNAIHRTNHEMLGAILAKDIIHRILRETIRGPVKKIIALRQEIMQAIYATEYNVRSLTVEGGIVKIADGTDMSMGRARVPYKLGKLDMHAMSALSIRSVEIGEGDDRPLRITIDMENMAGLFQVEEVLMPKIYTSSIENYVEIWLRVNDRFYKYYPLK
jgi:metal-dependent HD superfamily phosphatase/phosphodiesterase